MCAGGGSAARSDSPSHVCIARCGQVRWPAVPAICWMKPRAFCGLQPCPWAVIEDSARDQPASRTPRDNCSVQAAYFVSPTPCAAPRFALHCCSKSAACINPRRSLSPPCAGSPFRELSQIAAPPASLVRLTLTLYLYACLLCMALSCHPHPHLGFCMFSQYPIHPISLIPHCPSLQDITLHHGAQPTLAAAPVE